MCFVKSCRYSFLRMSLGLFTKLHAIGLTGLCRRLGRYGHVDVWGDAICAPFNGADFQKNCRDGIRGCQGIKVVFLVHRALSVWNRSFCSAWFKRRRMPVPKRSLYVVVLIGPDWAGLNHGSVYWRLHSLWMWLLWHNKRCCPLSHKIRSLAKTLSCFLFSNFLL